MRANGFAWLAVGRGEVHMRDPTIGPGLADEEYLPRQLHGANWMRGLDQVDAGHLGIHADRGDQGAIDGHEFGHEVQRRQAGCRPGQQLFKSCGRSVPATMSSHRGATRSDQWRASIETKLSTWSGRQGSNEPNTAARSISAA